MKCDADICKSLQVNVVFPGGITIDFMTMARTISIPQIGGLVQRREVTSVGLESLLDNDGLIVGSVSPRPTYFGRYSFDYRLLDEASSTDRCTTFGETCSPQDLRQEWTVRLSFRVVVGGAISTWIAAVASLLVGLKRAWDQKLSSGLMLTSSNSASQMLSNIG